MNTLKKDYSKAVRENELVIVVSFDGSKSLDMWQQTTSFARSVGGRFTYFISGVYFITDEDKNEYKYPVDPSRTGLSEIGFGGTKEEVEARKATLINAFREGHEMGSHLNGHFDSSQWSQDAMNIELDQYQKFTSFLPNPSKSVRFPLLAFNENLWRPLMEHGFNAVVSLNLSPVNEVVIQTSADSQYMCAGYPIPYINDGRYRQISMDYNLYYYDQHKAPERTDSEIENLVYLTYMQQAKDAISSRMPLFLNHHFELFKHGAYWRALQRSVSELVQTYKSGPVRFATISELTKVILS
jgi:hypothetical protein